MASLSSYSRKRLCSNRTSESAPRNQMSTGEQIEVENVNTPGRVSRVNAAKYRDMKFAFLQVLPATAPGLSQAEIRAQVVPYLSDALFPQGRTAGWWAKTVQLDLEAKGRVVRQPGRPLRWHQKA